MISDLVVDKRAAQADLEGKCATVTLTGAVSDQSLTDAVTEAGYEVVSIQ